MSKMDNVEYVTGEPSNAGPAVAALNLNPPFPPHAVPRGARPTTVPMSFMPQLPLAERDRRWDALRKRMLMAVAGGTTPGCRAANSA